MFVIKVIVTHIHIGPFTPTWHGFAVELSYFQVVDCAEKCFLALQNLSKDLSDLKVLRIRGGRENREKKERK